MLLKARVIIDADHPGAYISPDIYGQFVEHLGMHVYDGIWVGPESTIPNQNGIRKDVIKALRKIKVPIIRWPGGCFADDYHWQDGIGPRDQRPSRANLHWDAIESNEFGTHEFIELCDQLDAIPYINMNVGSGTPKEMRDWLEYLNFPGETTLTRQRAANGHPEPFQVMHVGIGNESWGCGGHMTPEYYASEYRRFVTYMSSFGQMPLYQIAVGPNGADIEWTRRFFGAIAGMTCHCENMLYAVSAFALHYYCNTAGTATEYTEDQWYELLDKALLMESLILRHRATMDSFDPQRKVNLIVDEWGTSHPVVPGTKPTWHYQQNTIRDALVAALTLDTFNRHADIVKMSLIAQMVNVGHSLILTQEEQMITTPTYHVYDMYSMHQGGQSMPVRIETDKISYKSTNKPGNLTLVEGSASKKGKHFTVSLVNLHAVEPVDINLEFRGHDAPKLVSWHFLFPESGDIHEHNTFDHPSRVAPKTMYVDESDITLQPASVNVLGFDTA
ncbi:MAG TPA: alpha-L-arabinofuranosidase C-terminal domain-containing protein [Candidatus Lokiarchaeia archaeon]|nr:alpha-L-arabinofuranosidase C-terminal domain-containing protein [Candidatus Lokiarchaeia archaeon]